MFNYKEGIVLVRLAIEGELVRTLGAIVYIYQQSLFIYQINFVPKHGETDMVLWGNRTREHIENR